ncbi:MAG: FtsQ-type POTRA domain-containing protein [Oscillospiraceae bacterium]|nr:FtsQ-type POTRA domain-containing protein [Oscillospiraceae bacterium]
MAKRRRRRLRKQVSVGLVVISLIAAGILALLLTPLFNVHTVTVHGNKTVAREDIVRGSGIIEGTNIFGVSLSRVRDNLEGMNRIASVKVRRVLPSTISITVEEGAPTVYILSGGNCVGITSDGRVVSITSAPASLTGAEAPQLPFAAMDKPDAEENDESTEDEDIDEGSEEEPEPEPEEAEPIVLSTGLDRAVVVGMGGAQYKVGQKIVFDDEVKSEQLFKLLDEFLFDDICLGVNRVDMSRYDSIYMDYGAGLRISIGPAEELSFKLKSFKAIMGEQLSEDATGTLDLVRLTYDPKTR